MDAPFDLTQTDKLLGTTRAVRKRLDFDKPVDNQIILDCIALSQQAPTGSNTQMWRWVVVTDADKKAAIAEVYGHGAVYLEQARAALSEDDRQTHRVYDSADYLVTHLHEAPALVIPCVIGRPADGAPALEAASIYGSIMPAVWSFMLALRSRGLGSCWTTLHLAEEATVAKILGIPDDVQQVCLLPVAYTIGTDFKLATRQPPAEITHFNGWAQ